MTKRWCPECKFMQYDPHSHPRPPAAERREVLLHSIAPQRSELMLLPLARDAIAGCATANIVVNPQIAFRPRRLVVAPESLSYFDIVDLRVGNCSVFASTGSVPASAFPPPVDESVPLDNIKGMRTVQVGQYLCPMVMNRAPHSISFRAVMFGDTVG
jgi:hypothetical protein